MQQIILQQPKQITHSLLVNQDVKIDGQFDSIVLAGMGGSGHPGDLLNALGICNVPLFVHRNYNLPLDYMQHMGFQHPLIITSSYSGNTEEALSAYETARKNNLSLLVSTAGGKLMEWSQRDNIPLAKIDFTNMQPRHTLFAAFVGIYAALRNSQLTENIDQPLAQVATLLTDKTPDMEESAKKIAVVIQNKVPVFVAADPLGFAAKNFKIQTNENAKYPAFWNTLPELNHNELLGFSLLAESHNPNKFAVIMLHNQNDHPRNKARMQVTTDLYKNWGLTVKSITTQGTTPLEKIFYTVTFGLWTTYHLALLNQVDPIPVAGVESFKKKLKEVANEIT